MKRYAGETICLEEVTVLPLPWKEALFEEGLWIVPLVFLEFLRSATLLVLLLLPGTVVVMYGLVQVGGCFYLFCDF